MTSGYFSYTEHFKGLRKLLIDRSWSWGSSIREVPGGERDQMPYQIGWVHLGALVLSLVTLFHYHGRPKPLGFWIVIFSTIVSTLSVFMIHPRSVYVWKALDPFLKYLQFPWRFLILISFFVSLASGGVFLWLKKREALVWGVLVIAVVALNFSYFRPEKFISVTQDDYLSGEIWDKQIKRSIFDYLPIYALMPPAELSTSDYQIVTGIAQIENFKKSSNKISFSVNAKVPSQIMLSQYYFPGWKIKVNGTNTKIDYQNDLGLMTIEVNPGVSSVEARFTNTPIRVLGNGLTVVAGVGIITFLGYRKFKNKK